MRKAPWSLVILLLLGLCRSAGAAGPLDVTQGQINGLTAVGFWAVAGRETPATPANLLPADGMVVRLVTEQELDDEVSVPYGEWLLLPAGRYKFWLEGNGLISPSTSVLVYRPTPFAGQGMATVRQLVPAGRVALIPERPLGEHHVLRLLHQDSHLQGNELGTEMSRRVKGVAAQAGVLMPQGKIIAGVFDNERQEYLGLTRPVEVLPGATTWVDPDRPASDRSTLLVILERPEHLTERHRSDVEPKLALADGAVLAPDVVIPTRSRVFAVWYGLQGSTVTLSVRSRTVGIEPAEIRLRAGKIERYQGRLQVLPNLRVELQLPPELTVPAGATLEVRTLPSKTPLEMQPVRAQQESHAFPGLMAGQLEVVATVLPWVFTRTVDLSDGRDQEIVIAPEPCRFAGKVMRGRHPIPATVAFFLGKGRYVRFVADDEGVFAGLLMGCGMYVVAVEPMDAQTKPYSRFLADPIENGGELLIRLPDNHFTVRVTDQESGEAIAAARVVSASIAATGDRAVTEDTTDVDGLVRLQPLEVGELSIWAEADGYLRSQPLTREVRAEDEGSELTLTLEPQGKTSLLHLRLPGGEAAAGADIMLVAELTGAAPLWQGQADQRGRVRIPVAVPAAFILVRHEAAGFLLRPRAEWNASEATWTLPPAGGPLVVTVKRSWGDPAPRARVALWFAGYLINGPMLEWLTRSGPVDNYGQWRTAHLPAAPFQLAAFMPEAPFPATVSAAMAVGVPFPRPAAIEIQAFE